MRLVDEDVTSLDEVNRVPVEDEGERTATPAAAAGKKRVLVADDDRMIRLLVKMLLQRDGYEVLEAQNGQEAIDMALTNRPDLLITDLYLVKPFDSDVLLQRVRSVFVRHLRLAS